MRKIKAVLKLHDQGRTNREISRSLNISAGTVSHYVMRAKAAGLAWPLPDELGEDALYARLFPRLSAIGDTSRILPDLDLIHHELKRKGVTLSLLWTEYLSIHPTGYGYSRFCELYREFNSKLNPSMRLNHRAGDKLFVDYSGLTVPWTDKETGTIHHAEIFVAVLGASNYTYVEATNSQSLPNWINSHIHAFEFFHGVSASLVPDNLRSGVTKSHLYDPDVNGTYQEMADYYNTAVIPARAYSPQDKAKAEVGVQGIQRWILAPLRDIIFFSVAEINEAIFSRLTAYNERPFQELTGCRQSQFIEIDQPALKPLPSSRYEMGIWNKTKAVDYHVKADKHHYSIPHRHSKEVIEVRISDKIIECFYKGVRIALHQRSFEQGKHTTCREHMPKAHQDYFDWKPQQLVDWAQRIGENTAKLIDEVLQSYVIPHQASRACLGILRMEKRYGQDRLEKASIRALYFGAFRYKNIESILKNGLDKQPLPMLAGEAVVGATDIPHHDNVRGAEYYH